jgi:predicted DNA-binding transcriptional regulator YafY
LGVSLRTVYRDVATLIAQGAPIEGAAGLGYVLNPGFFLPPLMLTEDEADAVILGLGLAAQRGDAALEQVAGQALAKIAAVLPREIDDATATGGLLAAPSSAKPAHLSVIRRAIREEEKLHLQYTDRRGTATARTVWPVAIGFFESAEVLAAWCETRQDFRHFRLDRITAAEASRLRYPKRRRILLAEWRLQEGVEQSG